MNDASGEIVEEQSHAIDNNHDNDNNNGRGQGICAEIQKKPPISRVDPTRWWFASSAFPMIAGTLGPVASAFSICALVRPWRQHMPPGTDIQQAAFINDPEWLTVINAVQLAVALVANIFLLLNMARRVRFTLAMPVTIVGWYLSSITLVALAATAAGPLVAEPRDEFVWSQAFFYGAFSATLYFIVATLLVVTVLGANAGKYDKDFQLTTSQRTLMLQTIMFLMYLLIGALVFSTIEGWAYLDAVYWADVTLFTVGFGDMGASTTLGRALLFPYALVGVISLGLVIGSIRGLVLERGRRMINARMVEKKRRKIIRRLTRRGKDDVLEPIMEDTGTFTPEEDSGGGEAPAGGHPTTELERREQEFKLMRKIQQKAAKRRRWMAMGMSAGTWLMLWLVGARVFQSCEARYQGWTYFDSVYFAFVSLTTIGYGDVTPKSNAGRAFFVFWSLLALPTMTVLISNAGDTVVKSIRDVTNQLGSITILPGDGDMTKDAKAVLRTLSLGLMFRHNDDDDGGIREKPPGFLGQADARTESDDDDDDDDEDGGTDGEREDHRMAVSDEALADEEKVMDESARKDVENNTSLPPASRPRTASSMTMMGNNKDTSNSPKPGGLAHRPTGPDLCASIPTDRADYLVLLADEIARVSQHLKHKPPRKYTFAEWAWYLRLMGEDESSAETHRRARPHVHHRHLLHGPHDGEHGGHHGGVMGTAASVLGICKHKSHGTSGTATPEKRDGDGEDCDCKPDEVSSNQIQVNEVEEGKGSWSWVGTRSPLMGAQEEADWIHEKLVMRLASELRAARDEGREESWRKRRNSLGSG